MKRSLGSNDSLGALMSICPTATEEHKQRNNSNSSSHVFTNGLQMNMLEGLEEDGSLEESGHHITEKKRRLSVDQVKALEKYFEVENKLEPERKVKLAQELGLQPRQVAVWFQNRRARWKTKQLERDYGVLKATYDSLKHNYESLKQDNESLLKEIRELKSKFQEDKSQSNKVVVKEELAMVSEDDRKQTFLVDSSPTCDENAKDLNLESFHATNGLMGVSVFGDLKDGSSDSDTSAILNEENNNSSSSPNAAICSSSGVVLQSPSPASHFLISNGSSSSSMYGCFQFPESKAIPEDSYQPQFVKIEEHNFFGGDDSCTTFFADDQVPTLQWDTPDEWN